jgi:ubiquinone biosynthesis protein UbiJ
MPAATAYNPGMLKYWMNLATPAAQDRMILLLNHVLSRESHAMARLLPFAGKAVVLHLQNWPALLPAAPDLTLVVTPAGLFERQAGLDHALTALRIELEAANPALLALGALLGERPSVSVQGDAAFAGEISWLMENLRWDIEDDLAGVVGPAAAHQLSTWGRAAATAFAALARSAAAFKPSGSKAA